MSISIDSPNFTESSEAATDTSANLNSAMTVPADSLFEPITSTSTNGVFTADDLAKAREQEKQKLYPALDRAKEELALLRKEKEDREKEEARMRLDADAETKRRAEEDMDVRALLQQKEAEFSAQIESERSERERAFALLEQEQRFHDLQAYTTRAADAAREDIMPELLDLISGNTSEEVDHSINSLKERSQRIFESAQQSLTTARRDMVGTRITAPAAGPLDTNSDQRSFTPEDISQMSMADYQKYRTSLLGDASRSSSRGLFG